MKDSQAKIREIEKKIKELNHRLSLLKEELNRMRIERKEKFSEQKQSLDIMVKKEINMMSEFVNDSLRAISEQTSKHILHLHKEGEKARAEARKKALRAMQSVEKLAEKKVTDAVRKKINKERGKIKKEFAKIENMAITDDLTQAFNRRYFIPRMKVEMGIARRSGKAMSIIVFDIDNFKKINDIYGHPAGDKALSDMVRVFSHALREKDILVRYGGEEFVVILPGLEKGRAIKAADRLRKKISSRSICWEGNSFNIEVSGGVASFPEDAEEFTELFKVADSNLLKAKKSGKNKVVAGSLTEERINE